jgi:hypothetical protein
LKGPRETDADFLVRRFRSFPSSSFGTETIYEEIDPPLRLEPGPDTPSRTRARFAKSPVVFQDRRLDRRRPRLPEDLKRPRAVHDVPLRDARRLWDLAREAMVTRERDLDNFIHVNLRDVRMLDCGRGLEFACFGMVPERRLLLDTCYGFITLKNGVPIGYVLINALFRSAAVAYNVFSTFRGGEAAAVYGRVLGATRHLFGAEAVVIDPYQLGYENEEGLLSGAWWFYYKLGFRPEDPYVRGLVKEELARMRKDPAHRTPPGRLHEIASENVYFYQEGRRRSDVMGKVSLGGIGLAATLVLARRFGSDRETGIIRCAEEAAELMEIDRPAALPAGERLALERWSPLVLAIPGVRRWSVKERRDLGEVVRAKGGVRETDYLERFDRHPRLSAALVRLSRRTKAEGIG